MLITGIDKKRVEAYKPFNSFSKRTNQLIFNTSNAESKCFHIITKICIC